MNRYKFHATIIHFNVQKLHLDLRPYTKTLPKIHFLMALRISITGSHFDVLRSGSLLKCYSEGISVFLPPGLSFTVIFVSPFQQKVMACPVNQKGLMQDAQLSWRIIHWNLCEQVLSSTGLCLVQCAACQVSQTHTTICSKCGRVKWWWLSSKKWNSVLNFYEIILSLTAHL